MDSRKRNALIGWGIVLITLIVPIIVTIIGAVTSPHVTNIPIGHIAFIEADQPSEKTTMLRGLYWMDHKGTRRLLLHESEPQDIDNGSRDWISEPSISPDGAKVAFIKQLITLQEGHHSVINQIWLLKLKGDVNPELLGDLSKNNFPIPTRLAWSNDSNNVLYTINDRYYNLNVNNNSLNSHVLYNLNNGKSRYTEVSQTTLVGVYADNIPIYINRVDNALINNKSVIARNVSAASIDKNGSELAYASIGNDRIIIKSINKISPDRSIKANYGWSIFGRRRITSLRWSPDKEYIGYTVSKPPGADDEVFIASMKTGKINKLSFRAGQLRWDWGL